VKTDPNLCEAELLDWCKGKLAPFKRPKVAVFVEAIPRNPTGKVLKRVLRETYEASVSAPE
jgi:fatty-acyl-CoA synthase